MHKAGMSLSLALLLSIVGASENALTAQNDAVGKLGLNFQVFGAPEIGVTWLITPSVAIRPGLMFSWTKSSTPFGDNETSQYGVRTDVLLRLAESRGVTGYVAVGGTYNWMNESGDDPSFWTVRSLLGMRVRLMDRVAVFGEAGFSYQRIEGVIDARTFGTTTLPLGVIVFLK